MKSIDRRLWFLCVLIGVTFGSMPVLGSLFGIYGAQTAWGWSATESYSLFVGVPRFFFLVLGSFIGAAKALSHRLKANNPG